MSAVTSLAERVRQRSAALATRFTPRRGAEVPNAPNASSTAPKAPNAPARPARRVQVPTVLQMEAVECGAAALAMVLAYHRRVVPLEELRVACGVSRDGSKASNVLKAARAYGLVAKGFKKEPGDLKTIAGPMIVHWNFNHFVVLEGFKKGKAYLNDPATGPVVVSEAEFDQSFTGVVLTFEKSETFARGGEHPSLLGAVASRLPGSRASVAFVFLAGLALVVPGVVAPAFQKTFVDQVLVRGMTHWTRPLFILMAAAALVNAGLVWLQQHYLLRLQTKLAVETSGKFLWHVLRLPVVFFTQRFAGDIGNRVSINDRVARLLAGDLATTALNVLVVAFYAALLLRYDLVLALVGVLTAVLNVVALRVVSRRRADLSRRLVQDHGKLMGAAMNGLQIIETLKATGSESDFFGRWAGHQAKVNNAYQQLQLTTTFLSAVPPLLLSVNSALVLGVGGVRVMDGHLSIGMLTAVQALMLAFLNPVNRMVDLASSLSEVRGDMARLDDVLRAARDPYADELRSDEKAECLTVGGEAPVKLTGHLELRGVSFGYSRLDPPLIDDFSLTLRPGSRVALVGGSGCGKSTVAKLVAGLYEPWGGEILFDGKARTAYPRATVANSLAVVDQDVAMFEGTIKDNVTLWDDTVPEADLLQGARDACIHEDIAARPGGYAGPMEEGGRNFSGGQRQRIEIARALVGNPTVLVLDEATSALDPATEKIIDDNLRRRGCTCVIVAHRLSTIRDCDEILVLDRGKIVQRGTHASLMAERGHYRNLIAAE